ncbi:hypothetical protein [Fibrobacter sp.]
MKKMLLILSAVLMLVACASNPPENNDPARAKAHTAYDSADQEFDAESAE